MNLQLTSDICPVNGFNKSFRIIGPQPELNEMLCKAQTWWVSLISALRSFIKWHKHCFFRCLGWGQELREWKISCTCELSNHRRGLENTPIHAKHSHGPQQARTVIYSKIMHSGSRCRWRVSQLASRTLSLLSRPCWAPF